jgi:hypothetical protein
MHTVELLRQALDAARQVGYTVRQEWLGGSSGGACQLKGRKLLFLDVAGGPAEQLEQVLTALHGDPDILRLPMSLELLEALQLRKVA